MKVVLLRDISKLGQKGSVVDVANAYATNVLIPKGDVKAATEAVLNEIKQKEKAKAHHKELAHSIFLQLVEKLRANPPQISGKRHKDGSLFAHISDMDMVDAIFKASGISITAKQIHIKEPIKHHGTYMVELREGEKKADVQVIVKE
jgi:large subunit ribosomal protein L9